jgi:hypothetical protein
MKSGRRVKNHKVGLIGRRGRGWKEGKEGGGNLLT